MRAWLPVMLFLLVFAVPAGAQEVDREYSDTIFLFDDEGVAQKIENVKIKSVTYEQVEYEPRGGRGNTSSRPGTDVIQVTYGDVPREYGEGLDALRIRRDLEHVAVLEALRTILEGRQTRVAVDLRHAITPRGVRRVPVLRAACAPIRSRAARFRTSAAARLP